MTGRAITIVAALGGVAVGCQDPSPSEPGPAIPRACEARHAFPVEHARALDVLVVIDDSEAMAGFPDAAGELAMAAYELAESWCQPQDLHIGVITGDPAGDGVLVGSPPFLRWLDRPDGGAERNFAGPIRDAVEARVTSDLAGSAEQQPLEMAIRALHGRNPGFRRDHVPLLVVFVTATDDRSPRPVAHYAERLRDAASDPDNVLIAATDRPAGSKTRMSELLDDFPQRHASGSLVESDGVLTLFAPVLGCLLDLRSGPRCLADVDPDRYACVVSETTWRDDGTEWEALLPACADAPPGEPCWRIEVDEECSGQGIGARLFVDRTEYPREPTSVQVRCEVCALE